VSRGVGREDVTAQGIRQGLTASTPDSDTRHPNYQSTSSSRSRFPNGVPGSRNFLSSRTSVRRGLGFGISNGIVTNPKPSSKLQVKFNFKVKTRSIPKIKVNFKNEPKDQFESQDKASYCQTEDPNRNPK
jgi:hypothetical protein